jgi:assimilatory nitrate reductase catalytic subunit
MRAEDAQLHGVADGTLARLESAHGSMLARVKVSPTLRRGTLFVPIHWSDQYARLARVGALVNSATDPISGQPELKHTPVRITPYAPRWVGFVLSRRQLPLTESQSDATYAVRIKGEQFWRYEIAGDTPTDDWKRWARDMLCAPQIDGRAEWLDFLDAGHGHYHGVRLFTQPEVGSALESCVFIAPSAPMLPARSWLAELIVKATVSPQERMSLLAGVAPRGQVASGPAVCACFGVDATTIQHAIRERSLTSVEAIGQACRAGTNCGSCIPQLKSLLEEDRHRRDAA